MPRNERDREAPVGVEYDGPSGIARESTWLTHEDLVEGRDSTVTIEKVLRYPEVVFEQGRVKKNAIGLQFKETKRVLLVNSTNRKLLNSMFGSLTKAWKGQKITLFDTETEAYGETVKCVRIRKKGARAATAAEQFLHEDEGVKAATPATNGADISDPAVREKLLNESGDDGQLGLTE